MGIVNCIKESGNRVGVWEVAGSQSRYAEGNVNLPYNSVWWTFIRAHSRNM